jgi:stage II sporulation protein M
MPGKDSFGEIHLSLKDDAAYLKSIGACIWLSVFIFAATAVMGYYAAEFNPALADEWLKELDALKWILGQPPVIIMVIIFLKNFLASIMSALLGLGLGIMPLIVDITNGFMLGLVSYGVLQKEGLLYLLAGILPHGIIELPTVLVSIGLGFRLGYLLILSVLGERVDLRGEMKTAVRILIRWIMPLLLIAAAIETFITPIAISVVK